MTNTSTADHRRYQVFLSSTYTDLQEERQAITRAILRMNRCIPAGMELFTASNQPPWDVITSALTGTDYLILVIGNRYGSPSAGEDVSYTEKEYDFAIAHEIPVLAFISDERRPLYRSQIEPKKSQQALKALREKVQRAHTVEWWTTKEDLERKVPIALTREFEVNPRPGWTRGRTSRRRRPEWRARPRPCANCNACGAASPCTLTSARLRSSSSPEYRGGIATQLGLRGSECLTTDYFKRPPDQTKKNFRGPKTAPIFSASWFDGDLWPKTRRSKQLHSTPSTCPDRLSPAWRDG